MKKILPMLAFFTVVLGLNSYAFNLWFNGTALLNVTTGGPQCAKSSSPYTIPNPNVPPSPANFFLGEKLITRLDPNPSIAPNQAVINLNGGNNVISFNEICFNGELVETACGDAYVPVTPLLGVYAAQFSPTDVNTLTGSTQQWTCVDTNGYGVLGGNFYSPAFYAPPLPPPYTYPTTIGGAGPLAPNAR